MSIPLVLICHNNHFYVDNTISQARRFGLRVIVLDNASSYAATRSYLKRIKEEVEVIRLAENLGHTCWAQPPTYDALPARFFLSDPDLQWNPRLPPDFAAILEGLCAELDAGQVGFALDLSDGPAMFQDADYFRGHSILGWEAQFWTTRLPHPAYELYAAPIDTTFHLVDKERRGRRGVRVAGDFTAKHLPWYRGTAIPPHDLLHMYVTSHGSTTAKIVLREMARLRVLKDAIDECKHECRDSSFLAIAKRVKKDLARQLEGEE